MPVVLAGFVNDIRKVSTRDDHASQADFRCRCGMGGIS